MFNPTVKFPGRKIRTYTPANGIFDGPVISLLSMPRVLIEILSRAHAKRKKVLNGFTVGAFYWSFLE